MFWVLFSYQFERFLPAFKAPPVFSLFLLHLYALVACREDVRSSGVAHVRLLGDGSFAAQCRTALFGSPLQPQRAQKHSGTWGAAQNIQNKKRGRLQPARVLRIRHHAEGGGGMVNVISGKKSGSKLPSTLLAVGTSCSFQERGQSFRHWLRFLCLYFLCLYPSQGNLVSK